MSIFQCLNLTSNDLLEVHNDIWEVEAVPFSDGVESAWEGEFLEEYSRPVYSYVTLDFQLS